MRMSSNLVTLIVTLVIWIGVFLFLLRLDRKVEKLKKEIIP
jgi:CcmD family protein